MNRKIAVVPKWDQILNRVKLIKIQSQTIEYLIEGKRDLKTPELDRITSVKSCLEIIQDLISEAQAEINK